MRSLPTNHSPTISGVERMALTSVAPSPTSEIGTRLHLLDRLELRCRASR